MTTRSQGALLFSRLGSTQADTAQRLGVSTGIVAMWQSGQRLPGLPNRKLLFERFKIPIESWDAKPKKQRVTTALPGRLSPEWGESTVTGRIETLEGMVEGLMALAKNDNGATMLEKAKVMMSLASTLSSLCRLKGEEIAEVRVLRHPKWMALKQVLLAALESYPEALASVIDALEAFGRKAE